MPILAPENNSVENTSDQLISNMYANYDITDNITLNISAGIEKIDLTNSRYESSLVSGETSAVVRGQQGLRFQNTNRLTYKNDNSDHAFQVDLVHEQQSFEMDFREATTSKFSPTLRTLKSYLLLEYKIQIVETSMKNLNRF